jgi:hypothetical protein
MRVNSAATLCKKLVIVTYYQQTHQAKANLFSVIQNQKTVRDNFVVLKNTLWWSCGDRDHIFVVETVTGLIWEKGVYICFINAIHQSSIFDKFDKQSEWTLYTIWMTEVTEATTHQHTEVWKYNWVCTKKGYFHLRDQNISFKHLWKLKYEK